MNNSNGSNGSKFKQEETEDEDIVHIEQEHLETRKRAHEEKMKAESSKKSKVCQETHVKKETDISQVKGEPVESKVAQPTADVRATSNTRPSFFKKEPIVLNIKIKDVSVRPVKVQPVNSVKIEDDASEMSFDRTTRNREGPKSDLRFKEEVKVENGEAENVTIQEKEKTDKEKTEALQMELEEWTKKVQTELDQKLKEKEFEHERNMTIQKKENELLKKKLEERHTENKVTEEADDQVQGQNANIDCSHANNAIKEQEDPEGPPSDHGDSGDDEPISDEEESDENVDKDRDEAENVNEAGEEETGSSADRKKRAVMRKKCGQCGKILSINSLRQHIMRKHSGNKPHGCEICQKKFCRKVDLKLHSVVHNGKKEFKCDICGISFGFPNSVIRHKHEVHSDRREHQCDICGQWFGRKNSMVIHKDSVHAGTSKKKAPKNKKVKKDEK